MNQMINHELVVRHYVPAEVAASLLPTPSAFAAGDAADTAAETVAELVDAFTVLADWTDKYQYIIDLGKTLPALPDSIKQEAHRLHGCQSMVWLVLQQRGGRLYVHAASDAAIVSGLIALVCKVYHGRSPSEILATPPTFLQQLGLASHLSPTRSNGLHALVTAVQTVAAYVKNQAEAA